MAAESNAEPASWPECVVAPAREVVVEQRAVVEVARQRTAAAIGVGRRLDIAETRGEFRDRSGECRRIGARKIVRTAATIGHDIDLVAAIVVLPKTRILIAGTIATGRPREEAVKSDV